MMNRSRLIVCPAFAFALALVLMAAATFRDGPGAAFAEPSGPRIVVLVSHKAGPFEEALEGFKKCFIARAPNAGFEVYALDGDPARAVQVMEKVRQDGAGLIFTLGSLATATAVKCVSNVPIVAGLVLADDLLRCKPNVTGVSLDFPLETQLDWIRQILPDCGNIGVLYNPDKNLKKIETACALAQKRGIKLFCRKVAKPSELPEALDQLANRVDALWGIPDESVFTPETAKHLLLFSFRNRIPFIGLSGTWVKAGALFSLDWDYGDLGAQCAEMALKALHGGHTDSVESVCPPRKVLLSLNLKTAQHMKIEIPEALIRGSHQVFK